MFSLLALAKPICLFLHLIYVNSNWIDAHKTSQGSLPEAQHPLQNLKIYLIDLPLFIEVYIFWMRFNLNKNFVSDAWADMSLNKFKWT